jgi:putative oxidoreductase
LRTTGDKRVTATKSDWAKARELMVRRASSVRLSQTELEAIMPHGQIDFATRSKDGVLLFGRLLLATIFLHEGVTLLMNFDAAAAATAKLGVGPPLLAATILLQLSAGLSIALGIYASVGAFALGLFCLATALLFHTNFADQNELLHFEKDLAIAGGMFILCIAGPGSFCALRLLRKRP